MAKVLVVDDSAFIRKLLRETIERTDGLSTAGEAETGREALDKINILHPDVVVMDIIMPGVDGVWALEEIMRQNPTPAVIFSSVGAASSDIAREAFNAGALDVVAKPDSEDDLGRAIPELIAKIKAAAALDKNRLGEYSAKMRSASARRQTVPTPTLAAHQVTVIATSAGGPVSLYEVLSRFSKDFYGGVIMAQHMPGAFIGPFAEHVGRISPLNVKIAGKGDILYSRSALFSPTNATLTLHRTKKGAVCDITDKKIRLQPDINSVILSAVDAFHARVTLVVLSGLGDDGVKGAEAVKRAGGWVIAEDKSTAGVYSGMPYHTAKSGFCDETLPAHEIAAAVEKSFAYTPAAQKVKTATTQ